MGSTTEETAKTLASVDKTPAIYAGMLSQEHASLISNFIPENASFTFSNVGCLPLHIAVYIEFESHKDQYEFEKNMIEYEVKKWS